MTELKDCPCCGGTGELKDVRGQLRRGWVGCPKCGLYIQWVHDPNGAVAKWNRRVLDEFVPTYTEEYAEGKDFHDGVLFVMDALGEVTGDV